METVEKKQLTDNIGSSSSRQLPSAVVTKYRGKITRDVLFYHHNASAREPSVSMTTIGECGFEIINR